MQNGSSKLYGGSMRLAADKLLKKENNRKWLNTHKNKDKAGAEEEMLIRKNIEFAKDLFLSWDVDGDG
jgi:hypothetical protein